jgi:hypothetical protein
VLPFADLLVLREDLLEALFVGGEGLLVGGQVGSSPVLGDR